MCKILGMYYWAKYSYKVLINRTLVLSQKYGFYMISVRILLLF